MHTAVRVDASSHIGIGHLVRCLTLADALRRFGHDTTFVCRYVPPAWQQEVEARGHRCLRLSDITPPPGTTALERLGVTEVEDAISTRAALEPFPGDWVIVDQYALGEPWEAILQESGRRVVAIDDLANRVHSAEVVIDQNFFPEGEARYAGKVRAGAALLVGPVYALLRPEYRAHRETRGVRAGGIQNILVSLGGADPTNVTGKAVLALALPPLDTLDVVVVTGTDGGGAREFDAVKAQRRGRTTMLPPQPHLADLMAETDLVVGAGGTTTWERMCLGVPSVIVTIAPNQEILAQWLHDLGLTHLAGAAATVTVDDLHHAIAAMVAVPPAADVVERMMAQCDGLGVERVIRAMGLEAR